MATNESSKSIDVGICVSGGGLRAASFGLGALQALQEHRRLLRGPTSARYLSAVSGGSYICGAVTLVNAGSRACTTDGALLGSADLPDDAGPFEAGSPEALHLLHHCRYLVEDGGVRTAGKLVSLVFVSVLTMLTLVAWLGVMTLSTFDVMGGGLFTGTTGWDWLISHDVAWLAGLSGYAGFFMLLAVSLRVTAPLRANARYGRSAPSLVRRILLFLAALPILLASFAVAIYTIPLLVRELGRMPLMRSPRYLLEHAEFVAAALVVAVAVALAARTAGRLRPLAWARAVVGTVSSLLLLVAPYALAGLLMSWSGLAVASAMNDVESLRGIGLFWGVLLAAALTTPLPGLVSPHRPYRELLSRCFMVQRLPDGGAMAVRAPHKISLSSLAPAEAGVRYPELLICAAANVNNRGAAPAGSNVLPLVISSDLVALPTAGVSLATAELEKLESPPFGFGLVEPQPLMSLASAIATTGAAVSPSMGRMSMPRLRPFFATLNVRLGVWIPNPLSTRAQEAVKACRSRTFFVGIDQLLWEFFGRNSASKHQLYASDGGHYENLGLVELLRRRCEHIYVIDASGDRPGRATALMQAVLLAEAEIGCEIDVDLDAFAIDPVTSRPRSAHVTGTITYPDRPRNGVLKVVKLGVTEQHSSVLREYERRDRGFPYHSTLQQVYTAERFEAYRRLGKESIEQLFQEQVDLQDAVPTDVATTRRAAARRG